MVEISSRFSLANVVRRFAGETPHHPALSGDGRTFSFAELHDYTSRIAQLLSHEGVSAGDHVGIMARNSVDHFASLIAISKLGAVAVGINFRLSSKELALLVEESAPLLLLLDTECATIAPKGIPSLTFNDALTSAVASHDPIDPLNSHIDDIALILYSSGTTGLPKGTVLTNSNLSRTPLMGRDFYHMTASSVNLLTSPLFHIGGVGYGLTGYGNGGHTVIAPNMDPEMLLDLIASFQVTHTFCVPTVIRAVTDALNTHQVDVSSLELVAYGAAPIDDATLLRSMEALRCQFLGVYGMTEAAGSVTALKPEDHDPGGPRSALLRSVGRSLPWHRVLVFDPETGETCASGQVGEIWVQSDQIMKGYWKQPELSAEALTEDGWLRTGDAGWLDEHGFLFIHDRLKDMIISGGENIYPAEVERVLNAHPAVSQAIVIGIPHERWGETARALVILNQEITEDELIAFSREQLAHYKCPSSVIFVSSFPTNAAGKILKRELRSQFSG